MCKQEDDQHHRDVSALRRIRTEYEYKTMAALHFYFPFIALY